MLISCTGPLWFDLTILPTGAAPDLSAVSAVSETGGRPSNRKSNKRTAKDEYRQLLRLPVAPGHVEIPSAVAHRRSRKTLHGLVRPCADGNHTASGTLAHHRHDPDLVLPPESNVGPISEAVWPCEPAKHGCTLSQSQLRGLLGHAGRAGRLDASKHETRRSTRLPRCWSPDVLQATQAAPHRFRCGWRTQPCETDETHRSGTCQRHMAPSLQVEACLAAAATCERVQQTRLHTG